MEVVTKTCCITGHRDIPAEKKKFVEEELRKEVAAAIEDGYTRFISGFAEGADLMFAAVVAEAKKENDGRSFTFSISCRITSSSSSAGEKQ